MTVFTFGTLVNPAHYLETPDNTYVDPTSTGRTLMVRPPAGVTLLVKDNSTGLSLPNVTSLDHGYFSFTTTDVPVVQLSPDGGVTWIPLIGIEAEIGAAALAQNDSTALVVAQSAVDTVNGLLALGGQPGGFATLDSNGVLQLTQAAGMYPQVQNSDGSWGDRPATALSIVWVQWVAGSAPPATTGSIAGGPGMASIDYEVDVSLTLGA